MFKEKGKKEEPELLSEVEEDLEELEELKEDNFKYEKGIEGDKPGYQESDLSIDLSDLDNVLLPLCRILKNFEKRLKTIESKLEINSKQNSGRKK